MLHGAIETAESTTTEPDGDSSTVRPSAVGDIDHVPPGGVGVGELYFQRCRWCQTAVFRRLLCPACASTDLAWERSGGIGVISHVVIAGRSTRRPRALAMINMREGFSLRSRIFGAPPHTVRVGALVRLATDIQLDSQELLFRLCDSA
ncbi:Zn-ribbon domain-containing OB-fold protein [Streptomyces flaveolus]|uniref:Zn-ribbon domain-containing OB-fold protein n=1 Tax=Streptomyces flaveolus TaxID=67297 RepID=UPI0033EDFC82